MNEQGVCEMQEPFNAGRVIDVTSQCVKEKNPLNITFQVSHLDLLRDTVSSCHGPLQLATNCHSKLFIIKLHQALQNEEDFIFCELKSLDSRYVLDCTTWDDEQYTSVSQLKEVIGKKKLIFQTSLFGVDLIDVLNKTFDNLSNVVYCYNDTSFAQLSTESQELILSRNIINFQGTLCSFSSVLGDDSGYEMDVETLCDLMAEELIVIGESPRALAELPAAYSSSYQLISAERFIELVSNNKIYSYIFAVSGYGNVKEQLLNLCEGNQQIKDHLYNECDSQNIGNIIIFEENKQDSFENQRTFQNICKRSDKVTFWIRIQEKSLALNQVYDPFFYRQRKFRCVESVNIYVPKVREMFDCKDIAFVISSVPDIEILINTFCFDSDDVEKGLFNGNIFILADQGGEQQFRDACLKFSQVHWLQLEGDKIMWVKSHGSLDLIRLSEYNMREYDEEELASKMRGSLVLLAGDAGTGKSTTLTIMSNKLMKSQWIIRIDFKETSIRNNLKKLCKTPMLNDDILNFICDMDHLNLKHPMAKKILKYCLWKESNRSNKIVCILDGVDEILPEFQSKVKDFVRAFKHDSVYITTRQNPSLFEDQYSVPATLFQLIYSDEQCSFLMKYWFNHLISIPGNVYKDKKLHGNAKKILMNSSNLLGKNVEFDDNPLYLMFISEVSLPYIKEDKTDDFLKNCTDVNVLLQNIFKTKYEIYFKQRNPHISINSVEFNTMSDVFNDTLSKFAFKYFFPEYFGRMNVDVMSNVAKFASSFVLMGIFHSVSKSCEYHFTHRLFCEYYSACFIVKCLQKQSGYSDLYREVKEVVEKELFKTRDSDSYKMFMDFMLAADLPLHKAIFNGDFDTFIMLMDNKEMHPEVDALGRSVLHYAAQYGDEQILFTLINANCDVFQADVAGRIPLHYAARYRRTDSAKYLTVPYIDVMEGDSSKTLLSKLINTEDGCGYTSLYYAADNKEWDLCVWLIIHGASYQNLSHVCKSDIINEIVKMPGPLNDLLQVIISLIDGSSEVMSLIKQNYMKSFLYTVFRSHHMSSIKSALKLLQENNIRIQDYEEEDLRSYFLNRVDHLADNDHLYILQYYFEHEICYEFIESYLDIPISKYLKTASKMGHLETFKYIINYADNIFKTKHSHSSTLSNDTWVTYFGYISFYKFIKTAIKYNHKNVVEYIWNKYRDLIVDESGNTALILAAQCGNLDIIKCLYENGAEVNVGNKEGKVPLHFAAEERRLEAMKYLVSKGGDVNAADSSGKTVLDYARRNNLYENLFYLDDEFLCVKYLVLDCNASSAEFNNFNKTHVELVLKVTHETVNIPVDGTTLLHVAVEMENETFVRYLLSLGADPNARNAEDKTPLECMKKPSPISHILFQHGARFNSSTQHHLTKSHCFHRNDGKIPVKDTTALGMLHYGMRDGLINSYYFEKDCYYCISQKEFGTKPLKISTEISNIADLFEKMEDVIHNDYYFEVQKLTNQQFPLVYLINAVDSVGQTLAHRAAQLGDTEAMNMITNYDTFFVDRNDQVYELQGYKQSNIISLQDDNGDSPLHIAACHGHLDTVNVLLKNGAVYDSLNNSGETPAQCCTHSDIITIFKNIETFLIFVKENIHDEIDKILFENNDFAYVRDKLGRTALHWVVENDNLKIVQLLLDRGAIVDAPDNAKRTPLHYAAQIGSSDCIRELLIHGAVFSSQDKDGRTPLELCEDDTCRAYFNCITQIFDCVQTTGIDENGAMKLIENTEERENIILALVNTRNQRRNTLLHYAAIRGYLDTIHFILKNGGMYCTDQNMIQSPSEGSYNHLNVFHLLDVISDLYNGRNINHCYVEHSIKDDHATLISICNARQGDVFLHRVQDVCLAKWLVKYSINILDSKDYDGKTPLMRAVERGNMFIVKVLCEGGANINKQDYNGNTALHVAVNVPMPYFSVVKYLVEQGADITLKNRDGHTPVDLARKRKQKHQRILHFLQNV